MGHVIKFKKSARKEISYLPLLIKDRIIDAIEALSIAPRPSGSKKLKGRDAYRIRVGDYRVIYEIHDDILVVLVIRVAHRSEVYQSEERYLKGARKKQKGDYTQWYTK